MNTQICKWLISLSVFLGLTFAASSAVAKKPAPPPPPPDPVSDGAVCADSGSFFPAFIYVEIRKDDEIYLSSEECSVTAPGIPVMARSDR